MPDLTYGLVRRGRYIGGGELRGHKTIPEVGETLRIEGEEHTTWVVTAVEARNYEGEAAYLILEDANHDDGDVKPDPQTYSEFQNTPAWSVVDHAIQGLFENQDIDKRTHTHFIVGYIVKALSVAEILNQTEG